MAGLIPIEDEQTAWHHCTWWSEGVADLTPYEDQEKIPIGMLVKGVGGLDPFCRRAEDKIPIGSDRYIYIGQRGWQV